jgi:AcrR family transcriptional regulator
MVSAHYTVKGEGMSDVERRQAVASPARQRILDAALELIRERGIGRVTTKDIAATAGAAEGSLFKNFGDKMGLLTELLSYQLPENRAWREVGLVIPPGQGDVVAALVASMQRAVDFYAAALPLIAGSFADRELLRRYRQHNRERGTGPQLAMEAISDYLSGWQKSGHLDSDADCYAMALALCGSAQMYAYTELASGADVLPKSRDVLIRGVIETVVGPHLVRTSTSGA